LGHTRKEESDEKTSDLLGTEADSALVLGINENLLIEFRV
jgi:hypothetical protein